MISNLYQSTSLHALFRKSQFTIFAITFVICSCTFATISMFTMETYAKQNLQLLSQTVIERIQPAVVFKRNNNYWQKVQRRLQTLLFYRIYSTNGFCMILLNL